MGDSCGRGSGYAVPMCQEGPGQYQDGGRPGQMWRPISRIGKLAVSS